MSAVLTPTRHKLSVEDYHRLGEAGILGEDSRVELIEGDLIDMVPIGGTHMGVVNRLTRLLVLGVRDLGEVSVQNPVRLSRYSEPQPDFAILRPRAGDAASAVPGVADVLLLIEVADTTLTYDRGTKLALYARSGIAEVWIVNLQAKCVEVYRQPAADGYGTRLDVARDGRVTPIALPAVSIPAGEIFG